MIRPFPTPRFRHAADRSTKVTVCIAARCNEGKNIVTVSDMKMTRGHYSADLSAIKTEQIHRGWIALIAGTFSQKYPILEEIKMELMPWDSKIPQRKVARACVAAFQNYGRRLAEETVLSPYGLTVSDFLSKRQELGDLLFQTLFADIAKVKVSCDLLVCGFDSAGNSHIFTVSTPTEENLSFVTHYDDPGFAAIGSGGYIAESTLYAFRQTFLDSLEDTLYQTCAAKFAAESASDVGDATWPLVMDAEQDDIYPETMLKEFRKLWVQNKPGVPPLAVELARKAKEEVAARGAGPKQLAAQTSEGQP